MSTKTWNDQLESVYVGCKRELQGRFDQTIGQLVGTVLDGQSDKIYFGDFECIGNKSLAFREPSTPLPATLLCIHHIDTQL